MTENIETTQTLTPEQIAQRINDLKTAGEAYRVIWAQVQEAEAALVRASRMASDLRSELVPGWDNKDEFEQWLYVMSNEIDRRRSDIGFFEQRVNGMGHDLRTKARDLARLMNEMPEKAEVIAISVGLFGEPKKD